MSSTQPDHLSDFLVEKRNIVFVGEADSGESELAINLSLHLARSQTLPVHFFDLDMTKPLFRSRDLESTLDAQGVQVHYEAQFMDAPTTTGGVRQHLKNKDCYTLLDVGGDYIGARAIGGYAPLLNQTDTVVCYIINPYRPWSNTMERIDKVLGEVLGVSHIQLKQLQLMRVFAPASVQEAVDMTYKAFELADQDRNPVLILSDGVVGTMMEPVELPPMLSDEEVAAIKESKREWACVGHSLDCPTGRSWILPGQWSPDGQQQVNQNAANLYESWKSEAQAETYLVEDAELVLTGYGISARIAKSAVDKLRAEGIRAGLIRPITVYPFPDQAYDTINYDVCKYILDIEMAIPALMVEDVKVAVHGRCPIETCLCSGGNIMSQNAILQAARKLMEG